MALSFSSDLDEDFEDVSDIGPTRTRPLNVSTLQQGQPPRTPPTGKEPVREDRFVSRRGPPQLTPVSGYQRKDTPTASASKQARTPKSKTVFTDINRPPPTPVSQDITTMQKYLKQLGGGGFTCTKQMWMIAGGVLAVLLLILIIVLLILFVPRGGGNGDGGDGDIRLPGYAKLTEQKTCWFGGTPSSKCYHFEVPIDRDNEGGPRVTMQAVVFRSGLSDKGPPTFIIPDGPGEAFSNFLTGQESYISALTRDIGDVVVLESRGGQGNQNTPQLTCPGASSAMLSAMNGTKGSDTAAAFNTLVQFFSDCRSSGTPTSAISEADIAKFTSELIAKDVNEMRMGLGVPKINIWALGYGSIAAQVFVRDYAENLNALVIDSGVPMDKSIPDSGTSMRTTALATLSRRCSVNAQCQASFPDVVSNYASITSSLRSSPVVIPMQIGGKEVFISFGDVLFHHTFFQMLSDSANIRYLPKLLFDFEKGDYSMWQVLAGPYVNFPSRAWGLFFAQTCVEEFPFAEVEATPSSTPTPAATTTPAAGSNDTASATPTPAATNGTDTSAPATIRLAEEREGELHLTQNLALTFSVSAYMGLHPFGNVGKEVCKRWNLPASDPKANQYFEGNVSTVILHGDFDPYTLPSWHTDLNTRMRPVINFKAEDRSHAESLEDTCFTSEAGPLLKNGPSATLACNVRGDVNWLTPLSTATPSATTAFSGTGFNGVAPDTWVASTSTAGLYVRSDLNYDPTAILQVVINHPDEAGNSSTFFDRAIDQALTSIQYDTTLSVTKISEYTKAGGEVAVTAGEGSAATTPTPTPTPAPSATPTDSNATAPAANNTRLLEYDVKQISIDLPKATSNATSPSPTPAVNPTDPVLPEGTWANYLINTPAWRKRFKASVLVSVSQSTTATHVILFVATPSELSVLKTLYFTQIVDAFQVPQ